MPRQEDPGGGEFLGQKLLCRVLQRTWMKKVCFWSEKVSMIDNVSSAGGDNLNRFFKTEM